MEVEHGDHICWIYDDDVSFASFTVSFIVNGINSNQKVLFFTPDEGHADTTTQEINKLLSEKGLDIDSVLSSGQLEYMTASFLDARVDIVGVVYSLREKAGRALGSGFNAMRIVSSYSYSKEMDLLDKAVQERHVKYEAMMTKMCQEYPHIIVLCAYDRRSFYEKALFKVMCTHPKTAINDDTIAPNLYFIPAEKYFSNDARDVHRHSLSNMLQSHKKELKLSQKLEDLMTKNNELQREIDLLRSSGSLAQPPQTQAGPSALERLLQQKSVAAISHEIRSPLNGIVASASLLSSSLGVTPEQRELVETIEASSSLLLEMFKDIIEASNAPSSTPTSPTFTPIMTRRLALSSPKLHTDPKKDLAMLIVEDNVINQTVLKKMIMKMGYHTPTIVGDGESAVALCRVNDYDVIFMDIFLPGISGLETTREINTIITNDKLRKKPVIVAVTASVTKEIKYECLDILGMDAFISKPVKMDVFTSVFMDAILPKLPNVRT